MPDDTEVFAPIFRAARQLRPGLRVLLMTGYAENAAMDRVFLEDGMALITRPFAVQTLAARLRAMIEGGR